MVAATAGRAAKVTEQDKTTTEEENPSEGPHRHKMPSVAALKKAVTEAKLKEQKRRYKEAMKWRCATEEDLRDGPESKKRLVQLLQQQRRQQQ